MISPSNRGVPVVATNDVRFIRREDFEAHEARVCIHDGALVGDPKRRRRFSEQQYLKSPQEMAALFKDVPEAIENTVEDGAPLQPGVEARQVGAAAVSDARRHEHGRFPARGIPSWLGAAPGTAGRGAERRRRMADDEYQPRLERELDVICQMGFAGYFLIVADFIRWARENGVPVGPGRGSGAGSLVAFVLGITDLDPLAL